MWAMGDKNLARQFARKAGVPVTPGSDGVVTEEHDALKVAKKVGYPVMIKAVAGGGGRGMRAAHNDASFLPAFHAARMEAEKAFGNGDAYIEKLIVNPHHIEFQIVADKHGHVVHLGERDCSIQRRNQKVIEECPSPLMTEGLRKKMGHACVKLAQAVGYQNAGTMEFLVDNSGHFYFMEMNTRIQVEHTITEEVYGCDLVKEQIRIAAGERLSPHVARASPRLHAIQCRINAEDPARNFQSSPGKIAFYYAPGGRGIRVDSHAYTGYVVPPYYDSLIAKLIAVGASRTSAIDRMLSALAEKLLTMSANIPLIANDHAEIAQRVQVQGVHVGQDDASIEKVRAQIKRAIVVGKSTHSIEQAVAAEREGADYIGFGPIFSTPTKPDYSPIGLAQIREVHERVSIPIFFISGIKSVNLPQVIAAGAKRVVIVSGLLQANDIAGYARACKKSLRNQVI